jgi:hypothetical protein
MTNLPQNVTSRYTRNLLVRGSNNEFVLQDVLRQYHTVDEIVVGQYYDATIVAVPGGKKTATGVTPEQAVHRCLHKWGVTFK